MSEVEGVPTTEGDDTYRQIFQALDIGLIRANLEGYLLEVNPRFATMLGSSQDDLVGMHFADITHPDDLAACLAQLDATLNGAPQQGVLTKRYLRLDGHPVWVRVQLLLLSDEQGHPQQFLGVAQEGIAGPSAATAISMAPDALPSSSGLEFIASLSHAMRTPLHAMLGFAQLLRVDPTQALSASQHNKVELIERSGANLLSLLSDAVDLSRIETQRMAMQIHLLPLGPLVDQTTTGMAREAAHAGVILHSHLQPESLCVWADGDHLRQILSKLLHHAIRGDAPGGRVTLEAQAINQQVAITVSHTGPGLSADQQTALLEPQGAGRDPGQLDTMSMGLRIVKRLTELMHGRVEVVSAPKLGTSIRLWLPQGQSAQELTEEEPFEARSAFAELDGLAGDQPLTVLYAEDNVINIELVRQVIRMRPQWHLQVAYCGQEAITMAQISPPDLLLLDMHLGDMKGLEVAHILSRQAQTSDVLKVALSADVMPDRIREARAQGFVDYLTKPLDVGRLLRLLDRVAQLKSS